MQEETANQAAPVAPPAPNPLHKAIAENVRANSQKVGRPTKLEIVGEDGQPRVAEFTLGVLAEMEALPEFADVNHVTLANGQIHVYSRRFITDAYADLWALTKSGDRLALVATVVRTDCVRYPRPTPADVFLDTPYHLTEQELDGVLEIFPTLPEYADIRSLVATTQRVYLYSDRHMSEQYARSLMEWEEVGRAQNP